METGQGPHGSKEVQLWDQSDRTGIPTPAAVWGWGEGPQTSHLTQPNFSGWVSNPDSHVVPKTLPNWAGTLTPSPGDLPDPGIELGSPALQVDSLPPEPPGKTKL